MLSTAVFLRVAAGNHPSAWSSGGSVTINSVSTAGVERLTRLRQAWNRSKHYRPFCQHGPRDPCTAASCTLPVGSLPRRWHVTTQELLIRHLRQLWSDDTPRTMVDLGCQAGHGPYRNTSDALLWLQHFHEPGSLVVTADASSATPPVLPTSTNYFGTTCSAPTPADS